MVKSEACGFTKARGDELSIVPMWPCVPGERSFPAFWLYGLAILALVAPSACGRSSRVRAADASTSTGTAATTDTATGTTDTGSGTATGTDTSTRADSGVAPDSGVGDASNVAPEGGDGRTGANAFTQISAGVNHTCGLRTDGSVTCWGNNSFG